jgi:GT2 family glycosyltransferase
VPKEKVSVVIPSWRGEKILPETLAALSQSEGIEAEVIVVDHGRENLLTKELVDHYSFRYVGRGQQLGFTGAVCLGVSLASHDRVLILCNDVRVERGTIRSLIAAFTEAATKGSKPVVFPAVNGKGPEPLIPNLLMGYVPRKGEVPYVFPDGSAFLYSKAHWGEPFFVDYFLYQEDVSFGFRVLLGGGEILLVPDATVFNFDGGTTRRTPSLVTYYSDRNRWCNYLSFFSLASLLKILPVLLLDFWARILFGHNRWARLRAALWVFTFRWWGHRKFVQERSVRGDEVILRGLSRRFFQDKGLGRFLNLLLRAYFRLVRLELAP